MPSPARIRTHHSRNRFSTNEQKENLSPNIGDLSPKVKAKLALNHHYDDSSYDSEIEKNRRRYVGSNSNSNSSYGSNQNNSINYINSNTRSNKTEPSLPPPSSSIPHRKLKPLASIRDPTRRQLLSRKPFAPFSHGTISKSNHALHNQNRKSSSDNDGPKNKRRRRRHDRKKSNSYGSSKNNNNNKDLMPAYAFKNVQTGHLEIKFSPPKSNDIEMIHHRRDINGEEDIESNHHHCRSQHQPHHQQQNTATTTKNKSATVTPALYPIAINGGGIGVYTDPREFAKGGINTMSQNRHETTHGPIRSFVSFPWNFGNGTFSSEKRKKNAFQSIEYDGNDSSSNSNEDRMVNDIDIESGLNKALESELMDDENGIEVFNPWKTWEKIHNYVVRINERRGRGQSILSMNVLSPSSLSTTTTKNDTNAQNSKSEVMINKRKARVSSVYNDDDYDFAIVLQPKEVYSYWTDILDFREENGYHIPIDDDVNGELYSYSPPALGSRKRRREWNSQKENTNIRLHDDMVSFRQNNASVSHNGKREFYKQGYSLFDRAIANTTPPKSSHKKTSPIRSVARRIRRSLSHRRLTPTKTPPSSSTTRRRWGNTAHMSKPSIMSPPIRSVPKNSPKKGVRYGGTPHPAVKSFGGTNGVYSINKKKKRKKNPNSLEIEDIPTQLVPRGIAARTNGMSEFLWALERGIVVRRHRPNQDPIFVKLVSKDGGNTIHFKYVIPEDAYISFKGQKVRYNKEKALLKGIDDGEESITARWSEEKEHNRLSFDREQYNLSLPDYSHVRTSTGGGLKKAMIDKAAKGLFSGSFKAENIVAVNRASHVDPLSASDEPGTATLRETKSCITKEFQKTVNEDMSEEEKQKLVEKTLLKMPCDTRTFSIVLPGIAMVMSGMTSLKKSNTDWLKKANEDWHEGKGSEKTFGFIDFEAATAGEYWMLFRGFLLLQRDAMNHRFAAQRASGFGSKVNQQEIDQMKNTLTEKKDILQFVEPEDKSWFIKCFCKNDCKDESDYLHELRIPPSDYFLGFKSPGTQIWSRLRQAGLETKRIYDLDTKRVMIKIRCPTDRLMDVAEVLRLKMKTTDDYYMPFQEGSIEQFIVGSRSDANGGHSSASQLIFRSSIRQNIIDFIINSRIRDSGAELSGHTELGKSINTRLPMHMHAQLEEIYNVWVFFYKEENWIGESMTINSSSNENKMPSFLKRFCKGCFFQPLDSIEQYFGERVAFYFAWLQHCSLHLTYISFLGLIVFSCQMISGTFDHILRPYFSIVLMIWSFIVMVTWRKQQNFLAHRWGSMNYKQDETTRPQFRGECKKCSITDEMIVHNPSWKRWLKYCISIPITVAFTVLALIGFLIVHANRDIALARYFSEDDKSSIYDFNWSLSAIGKIQAIGAVTLSKENLSDFNFWYIVGAMPCALGLSLPLLNFILMQVSRRLNDFENYRTENQYLNALITKVIAFRFVTYFSALYYYAYVSTGQDSITVENSILRVATSLVIYLTVSHWWGVFLGIYVPLLVFRWRLYRKGINLGKKLREIESLEHEKADDGDLLTAKEKKKAKEQKIANRTILLEQAQSKIWEEILLPDYDPFYDYILAIIYFAFVTCFSAMLPLTPLLVLINQVISMRLNAYKICRSRRRPISRKAGGVSAILLPKQLFVVEVLIFRLINLFIHL